MKDENLPKDVEEPIETPPEKTETDLMLFEKWLDISVDTDRQLLTLATAAIGLLASFLTAKGVSSIAQLLLIIFSGGFFLMVIGCVLSVFHLNRSYLAIVLEKKVRPEEGLMKLLDKLARYSFVLGVLTTVIFAITIAATDLEKSFRQPSRDTSNEQRPSESSGNIQKPSQPSFVNKREPSGDATRTNRTDDASSSANASSNANINSDTNNPK